MRARRNKVGKTAIKVFFSFLSTAIYFVLFIVESFSSSALNIFLLCRKSFFLSLAHFFLAFAISSHPHTIDWGFSRLREREGAKKASKKIKFFIVLLKHNTKVMPVKEKLFFGCRLRLYWWLLTARHKGHATECFSVITRA